LIIAYFLEEALLGLSDPDKSDIMFPG